MNKQSKNSHHIVVVGAGILGASIAFHLILRGAQVTIVDAAEPGKGTTRISFAWLNAFGKNPFHYHDINRRSMEMWERFVRRIGAVDAVTWGGELKGARTEAGARELAERVEKVQEWGYPSRLVDAYEVKELEPNLNVEQMAAIAYTDIEGHVDTQQVVQSCMKALGAQGAEICIHTPVTGFQFSGGNSAMVEAVQIGDITIPCDGVVLAGGPDMSALATMAQIKLPVYHTFGATILTEPIAPLFQTIAIYHPSVDSQPVVNFRQFRDGTVMVQGGSTDNVEVGDRGKSDEEVAQILADAATHLPALKDVRIKAIQRGRRPIPQDGHPILGFSESVANLYLATTHSGITLAPIIGELAAIEIVDRTAVDLFTPYRPARFQ
ncbi:MAG: FAD-dependent oxidoreductase [Chloroflexota bacterium]